MPEGFLLFPHRQMRLEVRVGQIAVLIVMRAVSMALDIKIMRLLTALVDKVLGKRQKARFPGHFIEAHQCQLRDLMPRITAFFALLAADFRLDIVGKASGDVDKRFLPRRFVVRDRGFHKMTEAVQLMIVPKIREFPVPAVQNVIGVEISVGGLRAGHELNRFVRRLLKLGVRVLRQGVRDGLHPLVEVRVLKDEAVKAIVLRVLRVFRKHLKSALRKYRILKAAVGFLLRAKLCRRPEIVHGVALRRTGDPVVQGFPLIGNDFFSYEFNFMRPEFIGDLQLFKVRRAVLGILTHLTVSSFLSSLKMVCEARLKHGSLYCLVNPHAVRGNSDGQDAVRKAGCLFAPELRECFIARKPLRNFLRRHADDKLLVR